MCPELYGTCPDMPSPAAHCFTPFDTLVSAVWYQVFLAGLFSGVRSSSSSDSDSPSSPATDTAVEVGREPGRLWGWKDDGREWGRDDGREVVCGVARLLRLAVAL